MPKTPPRPSPHTSMRGISDRQGLNSPLSPRFGAAFCSWRRCFLGPRPFWVISRTYHVPVLRVRCRLFFFLDWILGELCTSSGPLCPCQALFFAISVDASAVHHFSSTLVPCGATQSSSYAVRCPLWIPRLHHPHIRTPLHSRMFMSCNLVWAASESDSRVAAAPHTRHRRGIMLQYLITVSRPFRSRSPRCSKAPLAQSGAQERWLVDCRLRRFVERHVCV